MAVGVLVVEQRAFSVTTRHELHAPILNGRLLERHPEVYGLKNPTVSIVRMILVPMRLSLIFGGLVNGVIENIAR
jgi:hypothetical protein